MSLMGIGIAREGAVGDIDREYMARQVVFREFGHVSSADHVRFDRAIPT